MSYLQTAEIPALQMALQNGQTMSKQLSQVQVPHKHGGGPCWCGYALDFLKFRREQEQATKDARNSNTQANPGMYAKVR
jgi:hypothetical protein